MWILIIIGVIVIIVVMSAASKAQAATENATLISEKSLAYADYLKRTSKDSDIQSMTTNEVREFVATKVRSYNKEKQDIENGGAVLIGLVMFGAVIWAAAVQDFVPLGFGAVVAFAVYRYQGISATKVDAKYKTDGLDPIRLKIEKAS